MDRRAWIIGGMALLTARCAEAQQAGKVWRIGALAGSQDPGQHDAFVVALRELGYIEGHTVAIESRYADGHMERLAELAAELVRLKVDVIVAWSTPAVAAAKQSTTSIPIVMASSGDAVGTGLVASLARPGGNVTGVSWHRTEVATKWVEIIAETLPRASRIGVLWNSASPPDRISRAPLEEAGRVKKVQIDLVEARSGSELRQAFDSLKRKRVEAVIVMPNPMNGAHKREIADLALNARLPSVYGDADSVRAGGLMAYRVDWTAMTRRAAYYVDRIFKGAKPADLPIEQPTKYTVVINLKTAKALGLTIPRSLLLRADEVIE
jgi:ABC-type uncharacterized transport system substrate-binding protein